MARHHLKTDGDIAPRGVTLAAFSAAFAIFFALLLGVFIWAYPQPALVVSPPNAAALKDDGQPVKKPDSFLGALPVAKDETESSPTTTILFVGDMMFDRNVAARSRKAGGVDYPFRRLGNLKNGVFGKYDLVIGNLEGPVTAVKKVVPKSIDFAFNREVPSVLKAEGFDAVSQANNHALDQGWDGYGESLRRLAAADISTFGSQTRFDATSSLTFVESRGHRVALAGFNSTDVRLDKEKVKTVLRRAEQEAEYVIVFMHWGNEYKDKPSADQVAVAHWLVDLGVTAVIGGHPHWMESVEVYKNRFIAYSLGNFIFDQDWSKETDYGLAVGLSVSEQGSGLKLFPVKIEKSQPFLLTGAERDVRLKRLADISDTGLTGGILGGSLYLSGK